MLHQTLQVTARTDLHLQVWFSTPMIATCCLSAVCRYRDVPHLLNCASACGTGLSDLRSTWARCRAIIRRRGWAGEYEKPHQPLALVVQLARLGGHLVVLLLQLVQEAQRLVHLLVERDIVGCSAPTTVVTSQAGCHRRAAAEELPLRHVPCSLLCSRTNSAASGCRCC